MKSNKLLHLTFDSLLGLATPSPRIESNAGELRRWAAQEGKTAQLAAGGTEPCIG